MMFKRHGVFARRGRLERRRNLRIASLGGLLLVAAAAIYGFAHAEQIAQLGGSNGLTGGNISGAFSYNSEPVNSSSQLARDQKVQLSLTFDISGTSNIYTAAQADKWEYNLSDLISGSDAIFGSVEPIEGGTGIVYYNGSRMGTYEISNSKILITADQEFWDTHPGLTAITAGVTLTLNVDSKKLGAQLVPTVAIPGSIDPSTHNAKTVSLGFETPTVDINDYVLDEQNDSWRSDNAGNVAITKDGNNQYIAEYNADFKTNTYFNDLTVTLDLSNNQSFTGDILIAYCEHTNCAANDSIKKVAIPSGYITYTDDDGDGRNDKATINMRGFLDYCEADASNCVVDGEKVISGYNINANSDTSNNHKYNLLYSGLIEGNPVTTSGQTYSSDSTISGHGENDTLYTATDHVEFTSVTDPVSASKTATKDETTDPATIHYVITIGDANTNLSGITIEDYITDNQALVGSTLEIRSNSGSTAVISNINSAAIDSTYSNNTIKFFDYTFPANSNDGPYTIEYDVILPHSDLGESEVNNRVDMIANNTTYQDIAHTKESHIFENPQTYVTKEAKSVDNANGVIEWLVRIYGPDETTDGVAGDTDSVTGEQGRNYFENIRIKDYTWHTGNIETLYNSAQVVTNYSNGNSVTTNLDSVAPDTADPNTPNVSLNINLTTETINGQEYVKLDKIHYGQVVELTYYTRASNEYKEQYKDQSVEITNYVEVEIDNRIETAHDKAIILQPTADVAVKTVTENSTPYYFEQENNGVKSYQRGNRQGYYWTVTFNDAAKGVASPDYEPYFTDTLPAGLFVANETYSQENPNYPVYQNGIDQDVSQANFIAYIDVERRVLNQWSPEHSQIQNVPITATQNNDGTVTIAPINLAALFNDQSCDISTLVVPNETCAGISGTQYKVTYRTSIAEWVWRDYAHDHVFTNLAELQEYDSTEGEFITHAYATEDAVYQTDTAIEKVDQSDVDLATDNLIEYNIRVNKEGAQLNNGNDLVITDEISDNMIFYNHDFFEAGSMNENDASNAPIVCMDGYTDTILTSCSFNYDSETSTITITVPDNTFVVIKYRIRVANPIPSSTQTFENSATFTNDFDVEFTDTVSKSHVINANQAWIVTNGSLQILKVDSQDTTKTIGGVEFKVTELGYDSATGLPDGSSSAHGGEDATYGTDSSNGIASVGGLTGTAIKNSVTTYGGLYYWEELNAPSPYIPTSTTAKHYFMLYDVASTSSQTTANRDAAVQIAANIENASSSDGIEPGDIMVIPGGYEWIVTNYAQETASLNIEKQVSGNKADPTKEFTILISATNSLGDDMTGQITAYSYSLDDPSTLTVIPEGVTFVDGLATITLAHNQGIKIDGFYVDGSYEVVENDYSAAADGGYMTTYICDDNDEEGGCADDNSGTVLATGQTVSIMNSSEFTPTGISNKKSLSFVLLGVAGGCVAALGAVILIKVRH